MHLETCCSFVKAQVMIQEEAEAMGNGHAELTNGAAANPLLDAPLEAEQPAEAAAAPAGATMMSKEARQLFAAGNGAAGLAAWKVWSMLGRPGWSCVGCGDAVIVCRSAWLLM